MQRGQKRQALIKSGVTQLISHRMARLTELSTARLTDLLTNSLGVDRLWSCAQFSHTHARQRHRFMYGAVAVMSDFEINLLHFTVLLLLLLFL